MKPGEGMHSAVEEVDLDPCDLYLDLGALIIEGRIPGLTDRGFGEGPHCPTAGALLNLQPPQSRHRCSPEAPECQRYEQIQKHMLLLWKNGIPMSIEVLLYPSCCIGSANIQNIDTASVPDMSYLMLEQWTVHMLPRRVPDATINCRGLMQAIRSFLHFSQLCAWFSLTKGKSPQNVHYRVCVPGEAFSSRFSASPDCHVFPVANIGRNAAMKVLVKTHPRCGEIPSVVCHKHAVPLPPTKPFGKAEQKDSCDKSAEEPATGAGDEDDDDDDEFLDGVLPTEVQQASRTSSPADTMLGESLLDPPNSLCMYPKRYQSPSRCGSPSLEVPEHLMFGKGATAKREAQRQRLTSDVQNRSRPLHRPVMERVLKNNLSENFHCSSASTDKCLDKHRSRLDEMFMGIEKGRTKLGIDLKNYLCCTEDLNAVPKAEMETVLHRLRNRCTGARYNTRDKTQTSYLFNDADGKLLSTHIPLDKNLQDMNSLCNEFEKLNLSSKSSTRFPFQPVGQSSHKSGSEPDVLPRKYKLNKTKFKSDQHSGREGTKQTDCSRIDLNVRACGRILDGDSLFLNQKFHRGQDSYCPPQDVSAELADKKHSNKFSDSEVKNTSYQCTGETTKKEKVPSSSSSSSPPSLNGVNIKKCGGLLESLKSEETDDRERKKSSAGGSPLLQKLLKASSPPIDECEFGNVAVPSAADKAQFRRSLDSATSLVFHKKSGLPLTSSPAPIRKSGTCFDFDSSLTSVSAIKRALFEKEPADCEHQQKVAHFSVSAPASTTVSSLLGTFEESVLNGRLEPVSTVEGFTAEIGASGSFCPRHITLPVTIFFYTLQDTDKVTSPYLGHINLGQREYHVPKRGTVQVTLFNPHHTVVKMFVVRYDLSDMPPNCQTFLRQRTLYMPTDASENDPDAQKWLRYLIHLRFASSKSGRIFLHTDIRMIIFRKSDLDAATVHGQWQYELRSFTQGPLNPKFSPRKL